MLRRCLSQLVLGGVNMAISQLEQAMATLRLSLAEMRNKEDQMANKLFV